MTALQLAVAVLCCVTFFAGCGGSHTSSAEESADGKPFDFKYAENLKITEYPGFTEVTLRNPWDTTKTLQRLVLVPKDSVLPDNLPEGAMTVRTPVDNALVYSGVHAGLLEELGAADKVGGMCDVEYLTDSELLRMVREGKIADCGNSQNPNTERIISMHPEVILLSPYENNDQEGKIKPLGIPIIECADYMETSPLGRAEWIRFFGLLFGAQREGDKIFSGIEADYLTLKELAAGSKDRPKVLTDSRYGQVWNVPCGNSTLGRLIEDAGGVNPFAGYARSGSVALAPERVLADAHDADVWLVRYDQGNEKSLIELAAESGVNSQFKAFKEGRVYGCNTRPTRYFEEIPFHPEKALRDMVIIFHPGLLDDQTRYFKQMK